ncbi:MAG: phosphate-starvation-inducible PsiE family protein [Cyanothece sp. SIO2G6]|nr:phosphate-starvation-inducible PsiE family protein [Cyanothece sp. SIO2G6]
MRLRRRLTSQFQDTRFLHGIEFLESSISKALSVAMVVVLVVAVTDLFIVLGGLVINRITFVEPDAFFSRRLFDIFGYFLDILIALEILENVTAYLKKHVVQVELVIVTSLTAIARKIIIFDFDKLGGFELLGLAAGIFSLSVSYWLVRRTRSTREVEAAQQEDPEGTQIP